MHKSTVFVCCCIGFCVGVIAQYWLKVPNHYLLLATACGIFTYLIFRPRVSSSVFGLLLIAIVSVGGMIRYEASVVKEELGNSFEQTLSLDGVVVTEPDVRPDKTLLTFKPYGYKQNVLIFLNRETGYRYGDRILVTGKVLEPTNSEDFNYKNYLLRFHTSAIMRKPKVIVLQRNKGEPYKAWLFGVKNLFIKQASKRLSDTESSLLLGILIGARRGLSAEVLDQFTATGTSHIIAISGYNISIIAASLGFLSKYIGRRWHMVVVMGLIIAFVIASGASSSVVRASVMGAIALLSSQFGRLYVITPSLCLSAGLMALQNPLVLISDGSFQLSFLATIGIVYLLPVLENSFKNFPELWSIKDTLLSTFAAIIITLPFILMQFGRLSLIAPVANIVILPIIPITMLLGFLAGLPVVGPGFALLSQWCLQYILWVVKFMASLPYASIDLPISGLACLAGYILIIIYWFLKKPSGAIKTALPLRERMVQ